VGVLLLGGILQSLLEVGAPARLLDTPFGRAVCVKAALVACLLACGAVNRSRTIPALARAANDGAPSGRTTLALSRTLRNEVALGLTALLVTGALAGYRPPAGAVPPPVPAEYGASAERHVPHVPLGSLRLLHP
jgi:putative copper export protein